MTTIKLHPPKELPEEGISAVAFEAWRNQVLSFLEQELINSEFISGLYATWHAKNTTPYQVLPNLSISFYKVPKDPLILPIKVLLNLSINL